MGHGSVWVMKKGRRGEREKGRRGEWGGIVKSGL
jgi:hypothetical protein